MNKQEQIEKMAEVIANMEEENAHYYDEYMQECPAFADCDNIAKALYDVGCRMYTKEQLELYDFYDREERIYQRELARQKKEREKNKVSRERDSRCSHCSSSRVVTCTDGFKFLGCFHSPYNGKWCVEIETCPICDKGE